MRGNEQMSSHKMGRVGFPSKKPSKNSGASKRFGALLGETRRVDSGSGLLHRTGLPKHFLTRFLTSLELGRQIFCAHGLLRVRRVAFLGALAAARDHECSEPTNHPCSKLPHQPSIGVPKFWKSKSGMKSNAWQKLVSHQRSQVCPVALYRV